MNKNKQGDDVSTCLFHFRIVGGQTLSLKLRAPSRNLPGQDNLPLQNELTHTHTDPCCDNWHASHLTYTIFGMCQETWIPQKKTHADIGRTCTGGPGRNQFLFSHQHYDEMTLNQMTLFKDCSRLQFFLFYEHVFGVLCVLGCYSAFFFSNNNFV